MTRIERALKQLQTDFEHPMPANVSVPLAHYVALLYVAEAVGLPETPKDALTYEERIDVALDELATAVLGPENEEGS